MGSNGHERRIVGNLVIHAPDRDDLWLVPVLRGEGQLGVAYLSDSHAPAAQYHCILAARRHCALRCHYTLRYHQALPCHYIFAAHSQCDHFSFGGRTGEPKCVRFSAALRDHQVGDGV